MFNFNVVREVLYGIGIVVALAAPPWPQPFTGWTWGRWILAVLVIIVLFLMLVSGPATATVR